MKRFILVAAVSVAGMCWNAGRISAQEPSNSIVAATNRFALDLYARYREHEGNIFYSPYSIVSALAMAYEGAVGETAQEMETVLYLPQDAKERRDSFLEIDRRLNTDNEACQLSVANALWTRGDMPLRDDYVKVVEQYYGGKAQSLDFGDQPEVSRLTINNWVAQRTNDRIKDLLPPGSIKPLTSLVLTNAVYFKGSWLEAFSRDRTRPGDFRVSPEKTIQVPMMQKTDRYRYAETEAWQVLELPYQGDGLAMLVLLPKGDDPAVLEKTLTVDKLEEWKKLLNYEEVEVSLPRFRFGAKYDLGEDLKSMGMPSAFTFGPADFSGMSEKEFRIDMVVHQALVEVNEEGTEAAAATGVVMLARSAPSIPKAFQADHPFLFIIEDRGTGQVIFIGRVSDPAQPEG